MTESQWLFPCFIRIVTIYRKVLIYKERCYDGPILFLVLKVDAQMQWLNKYSGCLEVENMEATKCEYRAFLFNSLFTDPPTQILINVN